MAYEDDFLKHFGVKGMKWGKVKDDPRSTKKPKSVSVEKQAKRNASAKKYDDIADGYQKQIDILSKGSYTSDYRKAMAHKQIVETSKLRDKAIKDAEAKRNGKLSSKQKKLVIGAAVAAALIATAVVVDQAEAGNITQLKAKGKAFVTRKPFEFAKNSALSDKSLSIDDVHERVVKKINPNYGDMGTKMNCRRATFAYEMRRRGLDVRATRTRNARGQNGQGLINAITPGTNKDTSTLAVVVRAVRENINRERKSIFEPAPLVDITKNFAAGAKNRIANADSAEAVLETLSKQPNGSRGEFGVMWKGGAGGHSMIYEVFNGKAVIFDGQTGKSYKDAETLKAITDNVANAGFTRLDNIDLNMDYLMKWVTNAG